MKSVFGGEGRRYYSLVHKVSSKYHKAGESQKIIVDQIELGRDPRCQVRYDESFSTVSRRHAAIVKDGDNWKLVPLSKTNSTYLNGRKLEKEWFLQNGDEIQLSTNGPKLGFIVPEGKAGLVKSIGLTARLSLFRQQALRPYKTAITSLACALVLCCSLGGYLLHNQHKDITGLQAENMILKDSLIATGKNQKELQDQIDSMKRNPPKQIVKIAQAPSDEVGDVVEKCKKYVYYIFALEYYDDGSPAMTPFMDSYGNYLDKDGHFIYSQDSNGKKFKLNIETTGMHDDDRIVSYQTGWSGTGFLLNDGRFVTARHCVQGWRSSSYSDAEVQQYGNIHTEITAYSPDGNTLNFSSDDFILDDSRDPQLSHTFENGKQLAWTGADFFNGSDWAVYKTSLKDGLGVDKDSSTKLSAGSELHILGYPKGMGAEDIRSVSPMYTKSEVAASGISSDGMIIHSHSTDHGNSGGPVMIYKNGEFYVVGIVTGGSASEILGQLTPIANIR